MTIFEYILKANVENLEVFERISERSSLPRQNVFVLKKLPVSPECVCLKEAPCLARISSLSRQNVFVLRKLPASPECSDGYHCSFPHGVPQRQLPYGVLFCSFYPTFFHGVPQFPFSVFPHGVPQCYLSLADPQVPAAKVDHLWCMCTDHAPLYTEDQTLHQQSIEFPEKNFHLAEDNPQTNSNKLKQFTEIS
ncbi:hypothetical protein MAR_034676 [Mya arenaria]|uniref:Uncharacterized protein n=1 Tax=Mya arenaria TaxID=6604 RepID=A0ABY7EI86_MYAAR|nr:hypothetical protein MAR_034676 [Mya arenaria]